MSSEDKDLFDRFDRPEKLREISRITRTIYKRVHPDWKGENTIDHIDIDVGNNTRSNLRLATILEQNRNRRKPRNNTSGHVGVCHESQRGKSGNTLHFWQANYKSKKRRFPYDAAGLKAACEYYRSVLLADGSFCQTCHPHDDLKIIQEPGELVKTFQYQIKFSPEDKDLFEKWTRADDARIMISNFSREIAKRIGLASTEGLSVDHINRNPFDQRRGNFRLATASEQALNRKVPQTNTSGHLGVFYFPVKEQSYQYWLSKYATTEGHKQKLFPYTAQGLKDACLFYRNVLRPDKTICPTCFPSAEETEERPAKRARTE